jgi:hypothetical protein
MMRLLATLFLWLLPLHAHAAEEMPQYLKDLDKAHRSGDWVLQCDSSRICRILGVVKKSGPASDTRAIITISRGIEKNARYYVRFSFVDDNGLVMPPPDEHVRLYSRGLPKMPPPVLLKLGPAEGEAAYPYYRVANDLGWRIVSGLQRWPGAVLRSRAKLVSLMPKGDLKKLLRKMDELQPPLSSVLTREEENKWMKEYNYVFVRVRPQEGQLTPDDVVLACKETRPAKSPEGWELNEDNLLWIARCPEGAKLFLQKRLKDPPVSFGEFAPPTSADVTDAQGRKRPVQDVQLDAATSILQLTIAQKDRWDCGLRLQYGYTKHGGFGVKEDRRMPMCRSIPQPYWLVAWAPTTWKMED